MQTEAEATMDLDAFFLEQDQRMNMPDDDFDEYLKRMGYKTRCTCKQTLMTISNYVGTRSEETRRMPVTPAHGTFEASKDIVHYRTQTSSMQQPTADMNEDCVPQATRR